MSSEDIEKQPPNHIPFLDEPQTQTQMQEEIIVRTNIQAQHFIFEEIFKQMEKNKLFGIEGLKMAIGDKKTDLWDGDPTALDTLEGIIEDSGLDIEQLLKFSEEILKPARTSKNYINDLQQADQKALDIFNKIKNSNLINELVSAFEIKNLNVGEYSYYPNLDSLSQGDLVYDVFYTHLISNILSKLRPYAERIPSAAHR